MRYNSIAVFVFAIRHRGPVPGRVGLLAGALFWCCESRRSGSRVEVL